MRTPTLPLGACSWFALDSIAEALATAIIPTRHETGTKPTFSLRPRWRGSLFRCRVGLVKPVVEQSVWVPLLIPFTI